MEEKFGGLLKLSRLAKVIAGILVGILSQATAAATPKQQAGPFTRSCRWSPEMECRVGYEGAVTDSEKVVLKGVLDEEDVRLLSLALTGRYG